ncbi:MAG: NAD(P)H-binding protein [Bacteroidetes bacterium]|nr:NAD(P)H-binding protein [Bacteroidota bacterium]
MLHILIIGAAGGIGRQAVDLALQQGHHVTALLRHPNKLPLAHPNLKIIQGDILQPHTYKDHLPNTDLVISAIGTSGATFFNDKPTTLYSEGNAALLAAMEPTTSSRVFFISASALDISPVLPWYARLAAKYIVQKLLKHMYADLRKMEQNIKASPLDWTIIRPPRLTDSPVTGHYRFAINSFLTNALKISRADTAHFILNNVSNESTYKSTIEIGY